MACRHGRYVMEARSMEKTNDYNSKKAEKVFKGSYKHKYALLSVCICIEISILVPHINSPLWAKVILLYGQPANSKYEKSISRMSKIVEQSEIIPLYDDFFRP